MVQLDTGRTTEDRDRDLDLGLLVVDVLDGAVEVRERAFLDEDVVEQQPDVLRPQHPGRHVGDRAVVEQALELRRHREVAHHVLELARLAGKESLDIGTAAVLDAADAIVDQRQPSRR